jgi:hypothetical protein
MLTTGSVARVRASRQRHAAPKTRTTTRTRVVGMALNPAIVAGLAAEHTLMNTWAAAGPALETEIPLRDNRGQTTRLFKWRPL